tara:strand:- start:240 stop:758 length:519 start_codon:yes stop_codon:yes gene_type:complete
MKRLLIIFFFLLSTKVTANEEQKFVYIDMEKILTTSKAGKFLLKQLTDINEKNLKVFKKNEKELIDIEQKLTSQKNIISSEEMGKKIVSLKEKIKKFRDDNGDKIRNLNKLKIDNTNKLLNMINSILTTYADKNSISIIFQKKNIIVGKTNLDVTKEIILLVDSSIKEFKIY